MSALFILDVPENDGIVRVAEQAENATLEEIGPYFRISSDGDILIDRRAVGVRHAVWYSAVAGLDGSRVAQHDKDALRVVSR